MARNIRAARIAAELTQEQAAAKARLAYKYWQSIERGVVDLHVTTLDRVARALRVPLVQLLTPVRGRPVTRKVFSKGKH